MTHPWSDAFARRSVLVTGHTGFKGSWLSIWLHALGARVSGYSLAPSTDPSNFVASGVRSLLAQHHEADIRDYDRFAKAINSAQPDVIFHLAAQPLVRESYRTPRETIEANVMGTTNLLEAVRQMSRPCTVVVITSDKCYENREHVWGYREIDAMGGHDTYSASKGAAELIVSSYRRSFFSPEKVAQHGVRLASARAGNVIGGGDWSADRIVTDLVKCLAKGEPVPVRSPMALRPWQHVLESLSGYLTLASHMLAANDEKTLRELCDGWNFGPLPDQAAPVKVLVERFIEAWGSGQWRDDSHGAHPHEANLLKLSIDKAMGKLKWRPRWDLDESVRRTANWYRIFYRGASSMLDACLGDIAAYESTDGGEGKEHPQ